jgi:hypothetical protein
VQLAGFQGRFSSMDLVSYLFFVTFGAPFSLDNDYFIFKLI